MALFKKRETVIQNIAYLGIMAAINVIFVLLTAILPPLMFIIIFVLPLTSAVVTVFCKKRYFPIYFVVTVALCILFTSGIYIFDTFFYVIPSLITGFLFGLMLEKKVPSIYMISLTTIAQYAITYLTFIILEAIMPEMNFINRLLNIFGLSSFVYKDLFVHIFLYLLSAIQTIFAYFILKIEVRKLGMEVNEGIAVPYILPIASIVAIILSTVFVFVYYPLTYIFVFINIGISLYMSMALIIKRRKLYYALLPIFLAISFGLFAGLYQFIDKPLSIILVSPFFLLTSGLYFYDFTVSKKDKQ